MKTNLIILLFLFNTFFIPTYSQTRTDSFFKDGERVNFIGNSITHNGDFHHYILTFYATRFPQEKVHFYNSGIKGDNANSFLRRMDADILPKKADWSIVMAGMNDVNRSLYNPEIQESSDIPTRKERALSDYRGYLENVIRRLLKSKTTIILQKPSIYDQTGDLPTPNFIGVNNALEECTQIMDELAKKYKLSTIDYWTILNQINLKLQETDPKATVIGNDRVHPGAIGNFIMAYQFLKSTDAPEYVSAIALEAGKLTNVRYAEVSELSVTEEIIQFKIQEESLPFPVPPNAEQALSLVPFSEEFNKQMLKISGLSDGKYSISIDGAFIGSFTAEEFSEGINLANINSTPQYKQALKVLEKATKYRNVQRKLRDIKFTEFSYFPENLWGKSDITEVEKFITSYLGFMHASNDKRYDHFKKIFDDYLKIKPEQEALEQQAAQLPDLIYNESTPVAHIVQIKRADTRMPDRNNAPFGTNVSGAEFAPHKAPGLYNREYTYPTVAQLDYFKSKGLILFRLPFLWERIQKDLNGELDEEELARMMTFVDAARERNLWVILDMHNYGKRYVNGNKETIGSPALSIEHVTDVWQKIATRFKYKDNIWGYGLMNEPNAMLASTPWIDIAQRLITEIRKVDMKTPIMVGGDSWSSAERWVEASDNLKTLKDPANNLIFEAHIYFDKDASGGYKKSYEEEEATPTIGVERAKPFVTWLKENNFKGFVGEYGVPDNDPRWLVTLDNMLRYLQQNNVNGTYWSAGPWWGKYLLAIEPRDGMDRPQIKVLEKYKYAEPYSK
ncbi:cellulase family glycosylhydrolase [Sphingobacterium phlebotomi]|uniref:Cellulase family glycosylhydrolase n=1 Tax=Sphingobacterium phlebotomi TaxID=2605433 RepID=A0A5D4HDY2_9SPHI|nr:cellulase family glycosylhydrolase [Sphingobacterium phlebotomi]TYR37755.1 cellulase family glycosylhydrolase [Sphingobacterium phlebotomi]